MQFLLGSLLAALFFICLFMAYTHGQKRATDTWRRTDPQAQEEDFELKEQREKAKRLKKGFDEMMSYNENIARKG